MLYSAACFSPLLMAGGLSLRMHDWHAHCMLVFQAWDALWATYEVEGACLNCLRPVPGRLSAFSNMLRALSYWPALYRSRPTCSQGAAQQSADR
jgi:hypothetical protein